MLEKKKILFAIDRMSIGGAPSLVFHQMKNIDKEKYEVHLMTLYPSKPNNFFPQITFLSEENIHKFKLRNRSPLDIFTLFSMWRLMVSERFDVVYTHLFLTNLLARIAAICAFVPIILSFEHSRYHNKNPWQIYADKSLSLFTDRIITPNKEIADFTAAQESIPREKFAVISYPFVVPPESSVDKKELRNMAGVQQSNFTFLTIARFSPEKGHDILLDAAREVCKIRNDIHFILIGHGSQQGKLRTYIKEHNLEQNIHLLPEAADHARDFYHVADAFLLTSRREGRPLTIGEAMLAGIPVIAPNLPGVDEMLDYGNGGILVEPENSNEFREAIIRMVDNYSTYKEIARERKKYAEQFSAEANAQKLVNLINKIV